MPNGADVPGGTGLVQVAVTIGKLFAGLFGDGGGFRVVQTEAQRDARIAAFQASRDPPIIPGRTTLAQIIAGTSIVTGRAPIPTPAEGGPPLVTGQVPDVPFEEEPLPILQELGIPFVDPFVPVPQTRRFEPGPAPFPDVEGFDMAVDATIFQAGVGGLPAILGRTQPVVGGVIGGLIQDIAGRFLRAPQELGAGQIPARVAQAGRLCPPERPSTRILRQIQMNTGVRIKLSSAKALVKQLGLENGARCLGISITDACTLIITPSPRRRRGISGSDIRIVKRTARRFQALQEDLSGLVSRRRAAPRRRARHVHAIQHTAPAG